MTQKETISKINSILINEFEIEPALVRPEADLIRDIEIDSLDFIDFVVSIEKNFGIRVRSEDLRNIRTIQNLYDFITSRVNR